MIDLFYRFVFILFFSLTSAPLSVGASKHDTVKPAVKYPSRHLVFQAGGVGEKPWLYNTSYVPKANFNSAVFTQLLYFDNSYNIIPGLFKNYSWDEKSSSYILEIDYSYSFDSKRPLRATDIEFALVKSFLTKDPKLKDRFRGFFDNIFGIEKLKPGMKYKTGICPGISVVDGKKIQIKLKKRNSFFLYFLGELIPPIAPIEDFEEDYFTYKKWPRGTGLYKVGWSDSRSSLVRLERKGINKNLVKNELFPLSIDMYIHGTAVENKADLTAGSGNNGTKGNKNYKRVNGTSPVAISVLDFHYGSNLGKNKLFREAISLALDRKRMLKGYQSGKPAHEMIPTVYYGRSKTSFEYNPKKSKEIISKHFTKVSSPEKPLRVWFHGYKNQKVKRYARSIAEQLKEVGLYVKFEAAEIISFSEDNRDVVFGIYGMVTSFVDPISPFTTYLTDKDMKFHADQRDMKARRIYLNAQNSDDRIEKAKYIAELSKYFQSQFMQIPLKELYPGFTHTNKVSNIGMREMSYKIDFNKVVVNK